MRQMLAARLHHPHWPAVLTEAIVIFIVMWILLPLSIIQGPASVGWWCVGGVTHDPTGSSSDTSNGWCESCCGSSAVNGGYPLTIGNEFTSFAPLGLTMIGSIYPLAVVASLFARSTSMGVAGSGIASTLTASRLME